MTPIAIPMGDIRSIGWRRMKGGEVVGSNPHTDISKKLKFANKKIAIPMILLRFLNENKMNLVITKVHSI